MEVGGGATVRGNGVYTLKAATTKVRTIAARDIGGIDSHAQSHAFVY